MEGLLDPVGRWVLWAVDRLGYSGLAALILLENVFPPIPSEAILPLAGFLAAQGRLSLPGVVLASTAGALAGALVLYGLGAALGEAPLRAAVRRYGPYARVQEADLDAAVRWFRRYGPAAVLLCRLVPIVRSLISLPAGLVRMGLPPFVALTALGAAAWNALLASLGFALGTHWPRVVGFVRAYERLVWIALALAVLAFLLRRRR